MVSGRGLADTLTLKSVKIRLVQSEYIRVQKYLISEDEVPIYRCHSGPSVFRLKGLVQHGPPFAFLHLF